MHNAMTQHKIMYGNSNTLTEESHQHNLKKTELQKPKFEH